VVLWDATTGQEVRRFEGTISTEKTGNTGLLFPTYTMPAWGTDPVSISADGKYVLTGSTSGGARLWEVATGREIHHFQEPGGQVVSVALSPDGQLVLIGNSEAGTMRLWEVATGRGVRRFVGYTLIETAAFSPDGRWVLTGCPDGTARLWEVATGQEVRRFVGHTDKVRSVAFSPDGRWALTGSEDKETRLWEVATGQEVRRFQGYVSAVRSMVSSSDWKFILTGSEDGVARLWEIGRGQEIHRLVGHDAGINAVAISEDRQYILTGSEDQTARLWEVATGKEVRRLEGPPARVNSVAFSPDGRFALTAHGNSQALLRGMFREGFYFREDPMNFRISHEMAVLWEVATGQEVRRFTEPPGMVNAVAFSPDGRFALVAGSSDSLKDLEENEDEEDQEDNSSDFLNGPVVLWDEATGLPLRRLAGSRGSETAVAISPDGRWVLTGNWDGTLVLWEVATGQEVRHLEKPPKSSGLRGEEEIIINPPEETGSLPSRADTQQVWADALRLYYEGLVLSVAFSPDGRYVFAAEWDRTVVLWEVATGRAVRSLEGFAGEVLAAAFSPDGQYLLTASSDKTVVLWEVATGREVRHFERPPKRAGLKGEEGITINSPGEAGSLLSRADMQQVWADALRPYVEGLVLSVAFSPDGRYLLTGEVDNTVGLWEVGTGREVRRFVGHTGAVRSVAFSPDGRWVLTGSKDQTARLWEVGTGREVRRFVGHTGAVRSVAFSPDGHVLTGIGRLDSLSPWEILGEMGTEGDEEETDPTDQGGDHGEPIRLWEVATARAMRHLGKDTPRVSSVAFSSDTRFVLTGEADGSARLWEVATGREIHRLAGHAGPVLVGAFSPDGQYVLTGSSDKTVVLWGTATGQEARRLARDSGLVLAVTFSPDGQYVLAGDWDGTARLWEVATGQEVRRLEGHTGPVQAVAFSPDGKYALTGSLDRTVRLWEVATSQIVRCLVGYGGGIVSAVFSPDGRSILTGGEDGTAQLWEVATGQEIHRLEGHEWAVNAVAFSPDGKYALTGGEDKTVRLWEVAMGQEVRRLAGHTGTIAAAVFTPDGRYVLTGSRGGDFLTRLALANEGQKKQENAVPEDDQEQVAEDEGGDEDVFKGPSLNGTAVLWDVATGQAVRRFPEHPGMVGSVGFSSDGQRILTGGIDGTAVLWDVATGQAVHRFQRPSEGTDPWSGAWYAVSHSIKDVFSFLLQSLLGGCAGVAISPEDRWVLTPSLAGTARLWDVATGQEVRRLAGHTGPVRSIAFSRDGQWALTASEDGTTRLWDPRTGRELCFLVSFTDGTWAVVVPDGRFDTNNLEVIQGLHWIMPDQPLTPLSIEIFMREYYEPQLLPRLLRGEKFPALPPLQNLNRVQPKVEIANIEPGGEDTVKITVKVAKASGVFQRDGKEVAVETGVRDLRLFREGQLVGYVPGPIPLNQAGEATKPFKVRLPHRVGTQQVEFSAYAFNDDLVKSATDRKDFALLTNLAPRKGRAYVITVGVNVNAGSDPAWNLSYAVNDARSMNSALTQRLRRSETYADVVSVSLLSEAGGENRATKAHFRAVLDLLAGREIPAEVLRGLPGAERVAPAMPEDLVLLAWSGHGFADERGVFYLFPSDTSVSATTNTPEGLAGAVSSDDLSEWLRDVDAGDIALIIDACHAAAAVEGQGFKPGPLGSRGLGQLSYDKGMCILAASQAKDAAFEIKLLEHGLLTYALVQEGLKENKAAQEGRVTLDGWLEYGVNRVPQLYTDWREGRMKIPVIAGVPPQKEDPRQFPSLFNFKKRKYEVILDPARERS
jgi:WD40 repeat protein/uncharacterized caspase-like protein